MTDDERGHFERGRWVPEITVMVNGEPIAVAGLSVSFRHEPAPAPHIPVGHYEKGRFVGGCFERKGDRLVCTNPGAVSIRLPLKS
jgi:uncharacterized Zn-binding protein involved in type VI secretion